MLSKALIFITVNNLVVLSSEKLRVSLLMFSIFGGGGPGVLKKFKKIILEENL